MGTLLWDTASATSWREQGRRRRRPVQVERQDAADRQLKTIGVTLRRDLPRVLAFSTSTTPATPTAFAASTWIVNKAELAWAESTPTPFGVDPSAWSAVKTPPPADRRRPRRVRRRERPILTAPGHTPGHAVLAVRLKKSGVVILSGDLYHLEANRKFQAHARL